MKIHTELEASDIDMTDPTNVSIALGITLATMRGNALAKEVKGNPEAGSLIGKTIVADFLNTLAATDLMIVPKESVPAAFRTDKES